MYLEPGILTPEDLAVVNVPPPPPPPPPPLPRSFFPRMFSLKGRV